MCLHSGVFTRAQFCHYFDTDRKRALRFVKALVERRQAVENETLVFSGGGKPCRISSKSIYRALGAEHIRHRRKAHRDVMIRRLLACSLARFRSGTSGHALASHRAGEGRVF